jgi:hypothetical protein
MESFYGLNHNFIESEGNQLFKPSKQFNVLVIKDKYVRKEG